MKLVIDIPKEEYKRMVEKWMFGRVDVWKDAICNGTPLPKGHGRLIDADAYILANKPRGIGNVYWEESDMYKRIQSMPTIVEADKEGAEE